MHKASILHVVDAGQPENKPSITRLLHSVHVENKNACTAVRNAIKAFVDEQNEDMSVIAYSGLLIQKDNILVHFIESENKQIEKFLEHVRGINKTLKTPMTFLILAFNERYLDRTFEVWGSEGVFTGESIYPHSSLAEEKVEAGIWAMYEKFLNAGRAIRKKLIEEGAFSAQTMKQAMDYLQITPSEVEAMFSTFSFSLSEYFALYHNSNNIMLDGELMWPVEGYVSELIEYSKEPYTQINGTNLI